ncbi:hypothetical protein Rsub_08205 [Raphidocelis subcapitata]|uniref:Autophagy-related protein 101 n=1 Tax=Raphidocelis subcapitata TaxID=307507 RepID=A0A2V0P884_9CHLO|nr:hypothetical protein Rsub_08205 [Raphidocelis subcapitata]|eukprot:GBF95769.1 hypothetical protein Rsub_08205 [Raphidocelis subcapitata]
MSNCEVFSLPVVEVELHQVREVCRAALHTIVFNRALGHVRPVDVDSELFDVTYVKCGDPEVDAVLEARISEFVGFIERQKAQDIAQLRLSFYEKRRRQASWLLPAQDERLYWEQWLLNLTVVSPDPFTQDHTSLTYTDAAGVRQARLQSAVEGLLAAVVRAVNDKRHHIPPVVSSSTLTFPFDVSMSGGSRSAFGLSAVRRMLSSATPPPVLGT